MLSTFIYKEKSWTCWMLSILQRKSWTCSGNVNVFVEFNDCVQLNQVQISMLQFANRLCIFVYAILCNLFDLSQFGSTTLTLMRNVWKIVLRVVTLLNKSLYYIVRCCTTLKEITQDIMPHCEMLRYTARCYVPTLITKNNILKMQILIG